jgi:hypothetical protein
MLGMVPPSGYRIAVSPIGHGNPDTIIAPHRFYPQETTLLLCQRDHTVSGDIKDIIAAKASLRGKNHRVILLRPAIIAPCLVLHLFTFPYRLITQYLITHYRILCHPIFFAKYTRL